MPLLETNLVYNTIELTEFTTSDSALDGLNAQAELLTSCFLMMTGFIRNPPTLNANLQLPDRN